MLVYFVNHSTAPINLGGAERSLLQLVEDWRAIDDDFEAVFITKAPRGKFIAALDERGWQYRAFGYRGWAFGRSELSKREMSFAAHDDYKATLQIVAMMEERRPDLVVTNTVVAPWGAFAAGILGIPHAWFVREYGDLDHGLTFQSGRASTFADIGLLSQAVFTNSLSLKAHVGQYLDVAKVSVVYPRVDLDHVVAQATEALVDDPFPQPDPGLKVTLVGRLSESKGQMRAIEAVGHLSQVGVKVSLCLVGGQEFVGTDTELMKRAGSLGIRDRVTIVGERENPFPYVASADVCITPSGIEAFGRSTLEYMALGKPVIASAGGGSEELVKDAKTGFLFPADDHLALAARLKQYAEDGKLARRHGAAGAVRASELMASEHSNRAAIDRLVRTASEEPYRLPQIARHWFALPGYFMQPGSGRRLTTTLAFVAPRVRGRLRSLFARAVRVVRRRAA